MKANEFITMAEGVLGTAFPEYVIRLFPDPDDDATFFAYVFCVPNGEERKAKEAVRAVIRKSLDGHEWDVIPSIKSLGTTRLHYPQYLRSHPAEPVVTNARVFEVVEALCADTACHLAGLDEALDQEDVDPGFSYQMPVDLNNHESQFRIAA